MLGVPKEGANATAGCLPPPVPGCSDAPTSATARRRANIVMPTRFGCSHCCRSVPSWAPSEDTLAHVRSLDNIEAEIDPDTFDQEVGELTRTGAELNRGPDAHWAWLLELEEGMEEEDACEFVIDAMWDIDSWLGSVDVAE